MVFLLKLRACGKEAMLSLDVAYLALYLATMLISHQLFCQNLSLFAKLFLDNKSVFFDVTGFHYYLLLHTSPVSPPSPTIPSSSPPPSSLPQSSSSQVPSLKHTITGFFSKEKLSWDSNNLACILIFPPYQRRGLGSVLIAVSYEIARRQGVLGGPEKPISPLGRGAYARYWGGVVSRWILDVGVREDAGSAAGTRGGRAGKGKLKKEVLVGVEEISRGTWIAEEDVVGALREMGVCEVLAGKRGRAGGGGGGGDEDDAPRRLKIDKRAVRTWMQENAVGMEEVIDVGGFVEGYGYREAADMDMGD